MSPEADDTTQQTFMVFSKLEEAADNTLKKKKR